MQDDELKKINEMATTANMNFSKYVTNAALAVSNGSVQFSVNGAPGLRLEISPEDWADVLSAAASMKQTPEEFILHSIVKSAEFVNERFL